MMRMNRGAVTVWILLTAVCVLRVVPAGATTGAAVSSIERLTELSDLVVYGTVGPIVSLVDRGSIYTHVQLEITEAWKGDPGPGTTLLKLNGGSVNGMHTTVVGAPCLDSGEEVILFLKANGAETFDIINLAEGKFSVEGVGGSAKVTRDLGGISYLDPRMPTDLPDSLGELKSIVIAAAH